MVDFGRPRIFQCGTETINHAALSDDRTHLETLTFGTPRIVRLQCSDHRLEPFMEIEHAYNHALSVPLELMTFSVRTTI